MFSFVDDMEGETRNRKDINCNAIGTSKKVHTLTDGMYVVIDQ